MFLSGLGQSLIGLKILLISYTFFLVTVTQDFRFCFEVKMIFFIAKIDKQNFNLRSKNTFAIF